MKLSKSAVAAGLLVFFIAVVVYLPAVRFDFTNWDDNEYVTDNPLIRDFSPAGLSRLFTTLHAGHYFPIVLLSYAVEYRLFGPDPTVFHSTNLILHALNSLLVFLLILLLSGKLSSAVLAGVLFGVHPAHIESVAWIAERKDVLYGSFFLGAMIAYLRYLRKPATGPYLLSLVFGILALLSKVMAVSLLPVLFLLDYHERRPVSRLSFVEKVPLALAVMLALILNRLARFPYQYVLQESPFTPAVVPLTIYRLVFHHLQRVIIPFPLFPLHPNRLDHPFPTGIFFATAAVLLFLLVAVAIASARRRRALTFGILFFLVTIAPTLRVLTPGYFAERYLYLPVLGLIYLAAALGGRLWTASENRPPARSILLTAFIALTISLGFLTTSRSFLWKDSVSLWTGAVNLYPSIPNGWFYRAKAFADRGELGPALTDLNRAINLDSTYFEAFMIRASVKARGGDFNGALEDLDKALSLNAHDPDLHYNRGVALGMAGRHEEAYRAYTRALELRPGHSEALWNRALTCDLLGRADEALEDLDRLSVLSPGDPFIARERNRIQGGRTAQ